MLNSYEIQIGTSPTKKDTDGDGLNDNVDPYPLIAGTPSPYSIEITLLKNGVKVNDTTLRELGYRCVNPERGGLACSWEGEGRMAEPETVMAALHEVAAAPARGSLTGRSVLVTAAGTWEAIDPVRFVGNRASGRMGYALAAAAARRGARVFLVSGPSALAPPAAVAGFRRVESAA